MIRKLALLAGAGYLVKKLLDRSRDGAARPEGDRAHAPRSSMGLKPRAAGASGPTGHVPTDLMGDTHPDGSARAAEHFRPDPTAPVAPEDREGLRPVTAPAPHDPPSR